ncbi:MAG: pentapeptide repeat-containing protein, partial [Vampirovibrionales bacterium]
MRMTSLSTPNYSTPRMAGLQAQASTANMAQAQKADAFTPSGRLQRQGFKDETQVYQAIKAIDTHLGRLTESPELWGRLKEVFMDEFGHIPKQAFQTHQANLQAQLEILKGQLDTRKYTGQWAYLVGLDLRKADLRKADLRWAQLQGADLQRAILDRAQLQGAILDRAQLQWAILSEADLTDVDLKGAFGVPRGITPEMLATARNTEVLEKCIGLSKLINMTTSPRSKKNLELRLQRFI